MRRGLTLLLILSGLLRVCVWSRERDKLAEICSRGTKTGAHCLPVFRNPSRKYDLRFWYESPVRNEPTALQISRELFFQQSSRYPGVSGVVSAVWKGESVGLPLSLLVFYTQTGMVAVLALSGQHASILLTLLRISFAAIGWPALHFCRRKRRASFFQKTHRLLPLVSVGILTVTSAAAPSMLRTAGMWLAVWVLHYRKKNTSTFQLVCTSTAILALIDPSLIAQPGFVLSVMATALLAQISILSTSFGFTWRYLLLNSLMPLLIFPWGLYYFGKVAWLSSLFGTGLGWVWEWGIIPLGFACPILDQALPKTLHDAVFSSLETAWQGFTRWHAPFHSEAAFQYLSLGRPSFAESLALECVVLCVTLGVAERLIQWASRGAEIDEKPRKS